jgi:hypothetical protein
MLALAMSQANALSKAVKDACTSDYAAYCNGLKVGTSELRSCMKAHSHMLSDPRVVVLGSSNLVTKKDIQQYKREMHKR